MAADREKLHADAGLRHPRARCAYSRWNLCDIAERACTGERDAERRLQHRPFGHKQERAISAGRRLSAALTTAESLPLREGDAYVRGMQEGPTVARDHPISDCSANCSDCPRAPRIVGTRLRAKSRWRLY